MSFETSSSSKFKIQRYRNAMERYELSRVAELAPLAALLPLSAELLVDLFGGTGFVSDHLGTRFDRTLLVDQAKDLMPDGDAQRITLCKNGVDPKELPSKFFNADAVVCLAGFHHILPKDCAANDMNAVNFLRVGTLQAWHEVLSPKGRIIVADVPVSGSSITKSFWCEAETKFLADYGEFPLPIVQEIVAVLKVDPDPAGFLQEFVKQASPSGHEAFYESGETLTSKLREAGYTNVDWQVRFTPWVFPDQRAAEWFVSELFAIGDATCDIPGKLTSALAEKVRGAIHRHLGGVTLSTGQFLMFWKLLYAWGDRDEH